jgi:hypothetical protein
LRAQLSGRSVDDLRASLARDEPDALAAKHGDQGQPAPGEGAP